MIKSYLRIAIRNIWKNKAVSGVKIGGLAIGLSAVLLIFHYVSFQYSYDNYHKNGDRIYRVAYHLTQAGLGRYDIAKTGLPLASLLQDNFPEIEATTRVTYFGEINIVHQNRSYKEPRFLFADPSILTMFSFPMKHGNPITALDQPNALIISSKIAEKYFGEENPVGKYLDDNRQFLITGVMDVPDNSHFRFDLLASYTIFFEMFPFKKNDNNYIDRSTFTYLMLKPNMKAADLENKLAQFTEPHIGKENYSSVKTYLEPLKTINLKSQAEGAYYGEFQLTKFTLPLMYLFEFLGLIIIGIACFNFINIAIAQVMDRTREVGVRKVYGSKKSEIFFQFICEYWLYSLVTILLSMLLVRVVLPFLSSILDRQIQVNYFEYFVASSIILFLVTVLAGAYPSLIVANMNPVNALQSGFKGLRAKKKKSVLVIAQFTVSIILILSSAYVSKQIYHYTEPDVIGFDTKNLLVLKMEHSKVVKDYEMFKSELLRNPDILSVSASSKIPAVTGAEYLNIQIDGGEEISFPYISIDGEFTKKMGIKTIAGRGFDADLRANSKSTFLISKLAVSRFRIDNPVGKGLVLYGSNNGVKIPISSGQIVGIVDDYAFKPVYETTNGVVFNCDPERFQAMFIRINPNKLKETLVKVEDTWKKQFPNIVMNASLLEDEISNEPIIKTLIKLQRFISAIAIFSFLIALLGLFGLSILVAKHRVKDIGIRRVNGATLWGLLVHMNRRFLNMVLLSIAISFPIVFFIIEELKKESSKVVNLSIGYYAIAFIVIILFAVLTVSWQSWKAARRNPVEALRYE